VYFLSPPRLRVRAHLADDTHTHTHFTYAHAHSDSAMYTYRGSITLSRICGHRYPLLYNPGYTILYILRIHDHGYIRFFPPASFVFTRAFLSFFLLADDTYIHPPLCNHHCIPINVRSRPTGAATDGWWSSLSHPSIFLPFRGPLPHGQPAGEGRDPKTGPLPGPPPRRHLRSLGPHMDFGPTPCQPYF
jgi:hypothetical protein